MEAEPDATEGAAEEERSMPSAEMTEQPSGETQEAYAPGVGSETQPVAPQTGGRRSQFRVVRESIQALQIEVGRYRKSHEVSAKKMEAQMASIRKDMATHARVKDLGAHFKGHHADTRRLEKQITSLRTELASMKSQMAKEGAKSRAREEAALSRIVSRVKAARPSKRLPAKPSKKKR